jgi:chemotaxis protein CheD
MPAVAAVRTLHPGDVVVGERDDRLETLLGSCVAVILADPRRTIGAMCHIVHAGPGGSDAHFADPALGAMFALLRTRAIEPRLCDAWVVGGGNMFPLLVRGPGHVGDRNVAAVLDHLRGEGVRTPRCDVGGSAYRRLRWTVGSGAPEVDVVPVRPMEGAWR